MIYQNSITKALFFYKPKYCSYHHCVVWQRLRGMMIIVWFCTILSYDLLYYIHKYTQGCMNTFWWTFQFPLILIFRSYDETLVKPVAKKLEPNQNLPSTFSTFKPSLINNPVENTTHLTHLTHSTHSNGVETRHNPESLLSNPSPGIPTPDYDVTGGEMTPEPGKNASGEISYQTKKSETLHQLLHTK